MGSWGALRAAGFAAMASCRGTGELVRASDEAGGIGLIMIAFSPERCMEVSMCRWYAAGRKLPANVR